MDKYTAAQYARDRDRDDYFFLDPEDDIDEACRIWWDNLDPWFQEHGYTLYEKLYFDGGIYEESPRTVFSGTTTFPYAHVGGDGDCADAYCALYPETRRPRLVFAQDSQSRHVCIKLLKPRSDEHKIISFLHQLSNQWDEGNFPCVIPVLDVLSNDKHHFAVFPRWNNGMDDLPWFNTMGEVLDFVRCTLKGLSFLHANKIFHRDIHERNILTNHFGCTRPLHASSNRLRQELRATRQLTYALTDFDLSLMLPADTDIKSCQLPISESYAGVTEKPYGAIHGELYFNPFAYDVACLGMTLSLRLQHLCSSLPILAPLFSGMLTSNIAERFTAEEALLFLDEYRPKVSGYELLPPPQRDYLENWETYDRWANVPPHLLVLWSKYKGECPSYFMEQLVSPLCKHRRGEIFVHSIRRLILRFGFVKAIYSNFKSQSVIFNCNAKTMTKFTPADYARKHDRDDYFFLDPDSDVDEEARTWWYNLRPWFQEHGYTLYEKEYINEKFGTYKEIPCSVFSGVQTFPYAYVGGDGDCPVRRGCSLGAPHIFPRLFFAQDSQSRHVCIKVLRPKSDECKIIKFLHQQSQLWDKTNFPCVIPVLDILSNERFQFAVFPRWDGVEDPLPWFNSMGEVMDYVRCVLKGLCFLHDSRIFHRDIHEGNILTNHFGCVYPLHLWSNKLRQVLRATGDITYALADFDLSLMLPADVDVKSYQLPISESYPGIPEKPYGVLHGELSFNPFAYDVACLGMALSYQLQHLCSSLPILAPLLSGMLTGNIAHRFTAHEALAFLDENRPRISEYEMVKPEERPFVQDWETYDRWSSVPPRFLEMWSKYKGEQPSYFMQRVVGPLCQRLWGLNLVYFVRRFFKCFGFLDSIFRRLTRVGSFGSPFGHR